MSRPLTLSLRLALRTLLVAAATLPALGLTAQEEATTPPTRWAVVKVNQEVRVLPSAEVKPLRKELETEWKAAVKAHEAARKQARKNKEEFTAEKPARPAFKVLKDGLKSRQDAETLRDKASGKDDAAGEDAPKGKAGALVVVRVGEKHRIVEATALSALKREIAQADKQAQADYKDAKKEAAKSGTPFDQPKPKKTAFKVIKKVASREEADALVAKLESQDR